LTANTKNLPENAMAENYFYIFHSLTKILIPNDFITIFQRLFQTLYERKDSLASEVLSEWIGAVLDMINKGVVPFF